MNRTDFDALKTGKAVYPPHVLNEMAIPSYSHWNPIIRWLMLKRLTTVMGFCGTRKYPTSMDLGTGTGVMLPFLSSVSERVFALDRMVEVARIRKEQTHLDNVTVVEMSGVSLPFDDNAVDLALALDVLEHFDSLDEIIKELWRVIKPGGLLIVSGPSENFMYKIGRFVAGFHNIADYHHWSVDDVNQCVNKYFQTVESRTLIWPARLFQVTRFRKN